VKKKTNGKLQKFKIQEKDITLEVSNGKQLKKLEKISKELNKKSYMYIQSKPMLKINEINEKSISVVLKNLAGKLDDKSNNITTKDRIFKELILGAYQDRMIAYIISAEEKYRDMEVIQSIRQKADNHLVRPIKAYTDFKKPPVKVSVRNLDQINISEKQVNISGKNTNDLDKK
jgi:hypothetical protein